MSEKLCLKPEEKEFFTLVSRATVANPFSDERTRIDFAIVGLFPDISRDQLYDAAILKVRNHIDRLEKSAEIDINRYSNEERRIMKNAILFDVFHQYREPFDHLISEQVLAGDRSLPVNFAGEAIDALTRRGFSTKEAVGIFALCYQVRRAYFFIFRELVGNSDCMQKLKEKLWNNVFTHNIDLYQKHLLDHMEDFSTLILGETGTGKGTAALAIGRSGHIPFDPHKNRFVESFMRSFVTLNVSQFPEALIESELFGHRKGAFTGAVNSHAGVFSRCSRHGAIFLDEIGEISVPIQIKLLKVLEERMFSPVGSHTVERFEGRIIAATNRSITTIREGGILRDDFYYRLCSDIITVPPLSRRIQENPDEFDALVSHTIARIIGKPSLELEEMVGDIIRRELGAGYHWPGNVRELGQRIRRTLLNRTCMGIEAGKTVTHQSSLEKDLQLGRIDATSLLQKYCHLLYSRYGTYGEVARRTRLDRRTVKKYILGWQEKKESRTAPVRLSGAQ